jgi:WD40 repeat protein
VAFSPDGKQVVSESIQGIVRLWDAVTGVALQPPKGHSRSVSLVAFLTNAKKEDNSLVLNNWVVEGEGKILWLPPEYRLTPFAVWNRIIVLRNLLGRMSILGFKEGLKYI